MPISAAEQSDPVTHIFPFSYYLLSWSSPKRLALAPCAVQ